MKHCERTTKDKENLEFIHNLLVPIDKVDKEEIWLHHHATNKKPWEEDGGRGKGEREEPPTPSACRRSFTLLLL